MPPSAHCWSTDGCARTCRIWHTSCVFPEREQLYPFPAQWTFAQPESIRAHYSVRSLPILRCSFWKLPGAVWGTPGILRRTLSRWNSLCSRSLRSWLRGCSPSFGDSSSRSLMKVPKTRLVCLHLDNTQTSNPKRITIRELAAWWTLYLHTWQLLSQFTSRRWKLPRGRSTGNCNHSSAWKSGESQPRLAYKQLDSPAIFGRIFL
jgi:hypothetical protein